MQHELNKKRLQNIYQMLFEMAAGNFNFKIPRTGQDDELEALLVLVNMVAEEMRASIFHFGYINPHFSYQYLVQNTLILAPDFTVESFSSDVPTNLGLNETEIVGKAFDELLDRDSVLVWNLIKGPIEWDANFHITIQLNFRTKNDLLIPAFCTISRLMHSTKILISSVTIVLEDNSAQNPVLLNPSGEMPKEEKKHDAKLIQQVYDYILDHLESPLPSIQELSQLFGTNEFKLKEGFRHFFNTSIYQFYNDERLKRAHLLIQKTSLPLKSIAYMCGFTTYTTFTKAFKKRFAYSPNILQRGSDSKP